MRSLTLTFLAAGLLSLGAVAAQAAHHKGHHCCKASAACASAKLDACAIGVKCCEAGNRGFWTKRECGSCAAPVAKGCCCGGEKAKKK